MIFRSLFAFTLIITVFLHTLNAIHPGYFQNHHHEELVDTNSNDIDDGRLAFVSKGNNDEDEEDYLIKRNRYPNFYLSPLWLSRRTRTNRFYGKPLWISRTG